MEKLNKDEMMGINANGLSAGAIVALIGAGIGFVVGILDGITRPFKCR